MAIIEFSPAWMSNCLQDKIADSVATTHIGPKFGSLYGNAANAGDFGLNLKIYKGVMPDREVMWASKLEYDADLLLHWERSGTPVNRTFPNDTTVEFTVTVPRVATQSGAATWFAFLIAGNTTNTVKWFGLGTIGAPGSGADLTIPSTSIISGSAYTFSGLRLVFPSVYEY